jgi:hypothetical protein
MRSANRATKKSDKMWDAGNPQSRGGRTAHYRHYAAQFRVLADAEPDELRRARLAKMARQYGRLAARTEAKG